jgi:hypothetical protein
MGQGRDQTIQQLGPMQRIPIEQNMSNNGKQRLLDTQEMPMHVDEFVPRLASGILLRFHQIQSALEVGEFINLDANVIRPS